MESVRLDDCLEIGRDHSLRPRFGSLTRLNRLNQLTKEGDVMSKKTVLIVVALAVVGAVTSFSAAAGAGEPVPEAVYYLNNVSVTP